MEEIIAILIDIRDRLISIDEKLNRLNDSVEELRNKDNTDRQQEFSDKPHDL